MSIKDIRIGLDLDGVVLNYEDAFRTYLINKKGFDPNKLKPAISYSFKEAGWFASNEEFVAAHTEAVESGLYRRLRPFPGASEKLWKLSNAGAHIHVITSRFVANHQHAKVVSDTAYSLDKNKIPFRSIGFDAKKTEHVADVYIDDSPSNIIALRGVKRNVLVYDALYNQDFPAPRAKNWDEVYSYVVNTFGTAAEKKELL